MQHVSVVQHATLAACAGGLPVGCQQLITTQDKAFAGVRTIMEVFRGASHGECEDKLRELEPMLPISESIAADYDGSTCTVYRGTCRARKAAGVQALDLVCHPTVDPGPECAGGDDEEQFHSRSRETAETTADEDFSTTPTGDVSSSGDSGEPDGPANPPPAQKPEAEPKKVEDEPEKGEEQPQTVAPKEEDGGKSDPEQEDTTPAPTEEPASRRDYWLRRFRRRRSSYGTRTYRGWRSLLSA